MFLLSTILIILLASFVIYGLRFGFVHTFGALVGTIAGALIASRCFEGLAQSVHQAMGGSLNLERIVIFFLIFALVNRVVGILVSLIDQTFHVLSFIPFLKAIDHLMGGGLGFLEGVLVLGLTLTVARHFPFLGIREVIEQSALAGKLIFGSAILLPLIPAAIRTVQETTSAYLE